MKGIRRATLVALVVVPFTSAALAGSPEILASDGRGNLTNLPVTASAIQMPVTSPHNFSFQLMRDEHNDAYFQEINWRSPQGIWKRVSWDEKGNFGGGWSRFYLHSLLPGVNPGTAWSYTLSDGSRHQETHAAIDYTVLSQDANGVTLRAQGTTQISALRVTDNIVFSGDTMNLEVTIENMLGLDMTVDVPVYFGALQVGNIVFGSGGGIVLSDSNLSLLRPDEAGYLIHDFSEQGAVPSSYPADIGVFSPVMSFYDANLSVGVQYVTPIEMPTSVDFVAKPRAQFTPLLETHIKTPINAGGAKTFRAVLGVADGDAWQAALAPYKSWFQSQYGTTPQFCPTSPFAYFVGTNAQIWGDPHSPPSPTNPFRVYNPDPYADGSVVIPNLYYDPTYPANRYYPNARFLDIWGRALPNIRSLGLEHYGVWSTPLWSGYLSEECNVCLTCGAPGNPCPQYCIEMPVCQFAANVELIDPALDIGHDAQALGGAAQAFEQAGAKLFWYTRTCSNINGADILNPESNNPIFVQGDYVPELDLRVPAVRDLQFQKYEFLARKGIKDFYVDYITCPGEYEFIDYIKTEISQRHGFTPLVIREGARDRDVLKGPGIPLLKLPQYHDTNSQLVAWLVPDATLYGGWANNVLTDDEIDDVIAKGYQPIISAVLFDPPGASPIPGLFEQWKDWMCAAYANQAARQQSYGAAMSCPAPFLPSYCGGVVMPPAIHGFTPASGAVGSAVAITGRNLAGTTAVRFHGTSAIGTSATFAVDSDTQVTATVPAGATTGPISVTTPAGSAVSATSFGVGPAPTISSFSPTGGAVGASVTINGTNFTGATSVRFNGLSASYTVNTPIRITAAVPAAATTGPIAVTTPFGTATSAGNFRVAPRITGFTPTGGAAGASVTVAGVNFTGATSVRFNGTSASFTVDSAAQLTTTVPANATTGPITVTTSAGTGTSASSFIVAPRITGFSPASGVVGASVTVNGANFTGATSVRFNGTSASFTVVTPTRITATVPAGATTGRISVTTSAGTATSTGSFTVKPNITGFVPTGGAVGAPVVITGTTFTGATAVRFNGTAATFIVNSATQITATVPAAATTGRIAVTTPGGTATSAANFVVAPRITSFTPASGTVGVHVTINGANFTAASSVKFNATSATFTVNSAIRITATVPAGATTGRITVTTSAGTATSASDFTVN